MDNKNELYFGGLPVEPDVNALMEAFPNIEVGDAFSYREVGDVLGVHYPDDRFKTVTTAWRKRLLDEHNIDLGVVTAWGFTSLSNSQRIRKDSRRVVLRGKNLRKYGRNLARIDTDDPIEASIRDTHIRVAAQTSFALESAAKAMRVVTLPAPFPSNPASPHRPSINKENNRDDQELQHRNHRRNPSAHAL